MRRRVRATQPEEHPGLQTSEEHLRTAHEEREVGARTLARHEPHDQRIIGGQTERTPRRVGRFVHDLVLVEHLVEEVVAGGVAAHVLPDHVLLGQPDQGEFREAHGSLRQLPRLQGADLLSQRDPVERQPLPLGRGVGQSDVQERAVRADASDVVDD